MPTPKYKRIARELQERYIKHLENSIEHRWAAKKLRPENAKEIKKFIDRVYYYNYRQAKEALRKSTTLVKDETNMIQRLLISKEKEIDGIIWGLLAKEEKLIPQKIALRGKLQMKLSPAEKEKAEKTETEELHREFAKLNKTFKELRIYLQRRKFHEAKKLHKK